MYKKEVIEIAKEKLSFYDVKSKKKFETDDYDVREKKGSFFAVGAAHLGGKEGVIALLRQEGYTLKPLHIQP